MKIISSNGKFEKEVIGLSKSRPSIFYISTFGMRVDSFIREVLENLPKECDVRILIGSKDSSSKKRSKFFKDYFKGHKIKVTDKLHTKLIVSDKGCILGGRNLTGSMWDDLSIKIVGKRNINELKNYYINLYNRKKSL